MGAVVYTRTDGRNGTPPIFLMTSGNDEYRLQYSVSEVQMFNDRLMAGCPFDANANAIALGSARCSYSGDIAADASLPSRTPLSVHLDDPSVFAHCDSSFGGSADIPLYPQSSCRRAPRRSAPARSGARCSESADR